VGKRKSVQIEERQDVGAEKESMDIGEKHQKERETAATDESPRAKNTWDEKTRQALHR